MGVTLCQDAVVCALIACVSVSDTVSPLQGVSTSTIDTLSVLSDT